MSWFKDWSYGGRIVFWGCFFFTEFIFIFVLSVIHGQPEHIFQAPISLHV